MYVSVSLCVSVPHVAVVQVIEDTATVVQHVRKERGVPQSVPIIVIGGSYGKQWYSTRCSSPALSTSCRSTLMTATDNCYSGLHR